MPQGATATIPSSGTQISIPTGLFINNAFVASVDSNERITAINPATEDVICSVVAGSIGDIDAAVKAAREAFKTTWGKNVTGFERSRLINKLADLIERDAQTLAELESLNNGKPVRIARDFDIGDSIQCLRYYAGWADKIVGQTIEVDNKTKIAFTRHEPIGVCGQIIPWNYPINMWAWKVAPALACGCTIVMKPSEVTPLTALVSLELGGKSPHLIFESADLDQAANWAALGICYNTGQDCTAGSRLYVQDSIHDKFVDILVRKMKEVKVGDGFRSDTSAGPVVSKTQYDRVWSYIEAGKTAGATVSLGGEKHSEKGYFIPPTVFTNVTPDMKIVQEEIFGPVLSVGRFATEEEAISLANNTTYGLGAGLHSNDASQCIRVSGALEAGTVWINQYNILNNNVPFGGKKQSGIGRELGSYALEEYTSVKAIHWNFGEKLDWPL
ncbi:hypothetical protein ONZ45_g61 [Pleurotus djamor]|nr:hypothetical protein ONZ45_g61 [Pleurotus djamor]